MNYLWLVQKLPQKVRRTLLELKDETIVKKYSHLIKPFDIIIVLVLLALSFLPNAIFAYQQATVKEEAKIYAIITIDGEEVQRIELSENTPREEFYFEPHDDQYNIIEVDGTRIRDKEDNSPDKYLLATRLMIEIVSTEPATSDNDTIIPVIKSMESSLQSWRTFFVPATVSLPRRRAFCPLPCGAPSGLKSHSALLIHNSFVYL